MKAGAGREVGAGEAEAQFLEECVAPGVCRAARGVEDLAGGGESAFHGAEARVDGGVCGQEKGGADELGERGDVCCCRGESLVFSALCDDGLEAGEALAGFGEIEPGEQVRGFHAAAAGKAVGIVRSVEVVEEEFGGIDAGGEAGRGGRGGRCGRCCAHGEFSGRARGSPAEGRMRTRIGAQSVQVRAVFARRGCGRGRWT